MGFSFRDYPRFTALRQVFGIKSFVLEVSGWCFCLILNFDLIKNESFRQVVLFMFISLKIRYLA